MKTTVQWKDAMKFDGVAGDHSVQMDAKKPIGNETGATPKELVAIGLGGCTAMDVIALLKKYKQLPTSFLVEVDVDPTTGAHPIVFAKAIVSFVVEGTVKADKLLEAVRLSQTKYCGVSAMLSASVPMEYRVVLNGAEIGTGVTNFESN